MHIFPFSLNQPILVYPQYRPIVPSGRGQSELGGGGNAGGFCQALNGFFSGCSTPDAPARSVIPPSINPVSVGSLTEKEPEKLGPTGEKIESDEKPSKPFYFVLPPNSILKPQYVQSILLPHLRSNVSPQIRNANAIAQPIEQLAAEIKPNEPSGKEQTDN